jgi:hypothetical protein
VSGLDARLSGRTRHKTKSSGALPELFSAVPSLRPHGGLLNPAGAYLAGCFALSAFAISFFN